ncbi:U3 small nucleolar RNA-associated protein 25-like protein [Acropora cervicornis]|uniref:U3 small nucleolar RNA-associated protein 25 homolog n=1 Tax=Acropora cervicornis TaxID=6130 RepID=A0AAD9VC27_ACRCE|nr:U3 small nucleolar RNA-associated protein 25-like protein [Acropora cervicornis]
MAKGKSRQKHGRRKGTQNLSKGEKRMLREYGSQHPLYDEFKPKKLKREQESVLKIEKLESSDEGEEEAHPYTELLDIFGIDAEANTQEMIKKWKENEDKEVQDEKTDVNKKKKKKKRRDLDHKTVVNDTTVKENGHNGNDDCKRVITGDDDDEMNEEDFEDYRKEEQAVEESDDEKDNSSDIDDDQKKASSGVGNGDPFVAHFEQDLDETSEKRLSDFTSWQKKTNKIPLFGNVVEVCPSFEALPTVHFDVNKETTFSDLKIKARLAKGWQKINNYDANSQGLFTPLQQNLLHHIYSYKDVFYSSRTFQNGNDVRNLYCLHAVNHILKTRSRVLKNTARIVRSWKEKKQIGELRDQGLTRPKVLILVPFRDAALKVVEVLIQLISSGEGGQVMNKKRFYKEFGDQDENDNSKDLKSEDFKLMFTGNIDDCFRIGISVSRKNMSLYATFYSSDIILASPLGLRTVIGNQGTYLRTFIFNPKNPTMWISRVCECGVLIAVKVSPPQLSGSICQVAVQVPQAYHRFGCASFEEEADKRFNFFLTKVLPQFKDSVLGHTAIFVPSYFDFVRLRNYFKSEGIGCAQISEYLQPGEIDRARSLFLRGKRPFLLFTERFYFFYRDLVKGIKNIIFYELPHYSTFYTDIVNYLDAKKRKSDSQLNPVTCTVLYSKFNILRLSGVVGTQRCSHMISSDKDVHMFYTGEEDD